MKLSSEFLSNNPALTDNFVNSSQQSRELFFHELYKLASTELSLAHSVFKTSACRTVLTLANQNTMDADTVGAFGTHKQYDTVILQDGKLMGKKHWVTNATIATIATIQVQTNSGILLCKTTLPSIKELFLHSPGMMDTETHDLVFENTDAIELYYKTDSKYFINSNHNNLCFISNYLGAASGLFEYMKQTALSVEHKNLVQLLDREIAVGVFEQTSSDRFWHNRNALYLQSKHLLVRICQRIMEYETGPFYSLNSIQGKHFFNCLIYSKHNGPIINNYNHMFTEPQDH